MSDITRDRNVVESSVKIARQSIEQKVDEFIEATSDLIAGQMLSVAKQIGVSQDVVTDELGPDGVKATAEKIRMLISIIPSICRERLSQARAWEHRTQKTGEYAGHPRKRSGGRLIVPQSIAPVQGAALAHYVFDCLSEFATILADAGYEVDGHVSSLTDGTPYRYVCDLFPWTPEMRRIWGEYETAAAELRKWVFQLQSLDSGDRRDRAASMWDNA